MGTKEQSYDMAHSDSTMSNYTIHLKFSIEVHNTKEDEFLTELKKYKDPAYIPPPESICVTIKQITGE